jgi:hypothetical protein
VKPGDPVFTIRPADEDDDSVREGRVIEVLLVPLPESPGAFTRWVEVEYADRVREKADVLVHAFPTPEAAAKARTRARGALPTCELCHEPETDCTCPHCGKCEERVDSTCSNCERCTDCCSCSTCSACDCRVADDDFCTECDCCYECCECGRGSGGREFLEPKKAFHVPRRDQLTENPSRRFVSAEIEVAEMDDDYYPGVLRACRRWGAGIVPDGSLPSSGFEINTAPAGGDLFCDQVTDICAALAEGGAKATRACGLHVHADARDLGYWELRRLIRVYALVEDALYEVVAPSRANSSYCARCGPEYLAWLERGFSPKDVKGAVFQAVYKREKRRHKTAEGRYYSKLHLGADKYHSARYQGLNVHSWFHRGTVECRVHSGTVCRDKVVNWGVLWAALVDYAATRTEADVRALGELRAPFDRLMLIAPTDTVRDHLVARRLHFRAHRDDS